MKWMVSVAVKIEEDCRRSSSNCKPRVSLLSSLPTIGKRVTCEPWRTIVMKSNSTDLHFWMSNPTSSISVRANTFVLPMVRWIVWSMPATEIFVIFFTPWICSINNHPRSWRISPNQKKPFRPVRSMLVWKCSPLPIWPWWTRAIFTFTITPWFHFWYKTTIYASFLRSPPNENRSEHNSEWNWSPKRPIVLLGVMSVRNWTSSITIDRWSATRYDHCTRKQSHLLLSSSPCFPVSFPAVICMAHWRSFTFRLGSVEFSNKRRPIVS